MLNVETEGGSGAGTTEPWLDGVDTFWSSWTADEEVVLLEQAGLAMVDAVDDGLAEDPFTWLICRRPGSVGRCWPEDPTAACSRGVSDVTN